MKKLHLLAIVALIMLGLSGCEKVKVDNQAAADVFVKAIKNDQGVTVYTAMHSVFSYNKISTVSVTSPIGSAIQLKNFENGGNSFFNEPVDADYSASVPAAGTYTYNVKFSDGEEKIYTNSLSSSSILPANIISLGKSTNGDSIYIKWDAITSTHAYQLKIMKGSTQVFNSDPFTKQDLKIGFSLIDLTLGGSGTYTFELTGLLFESTALEYLQAISTSSEDIAL